jgi:hypothetical protein
MKVGDVVNLHGQSRSDLDSDTGRKWVADCCRAGEGIITDAELSERWGLSPGDWLKIKTDKALARAVRLECQRREATGQAVKEAAARHLLKGVGIVDQIMTSADSHPKHRLDAFRELRTTAAVGADAEGRANSELFVIQINLGADTETYNINPSDVTINLDKNHDNE